MNGARPTIARAGAVERIGRELRFTFDVTWPDLRQARVQATATRSGLVVDLQADGDSGFLAGTSGDPRVDSFIREHVAGLAKGSTQRRPVVTPKRRR